MTSRQFEVRMTLVEFQTLLSKLAKTKGTTAAGSLLRDPNKDLSALIPKGVKFYPSPAKGTQFPPLADWVLFAVPSSEEEETLEYWVNKSEPKFAQAFVLLLIGLGPNKNEWKGWKLERGDALPISGLELVGAGMKTTRSLNLSSPGSSLQSRLGGILESAEPPKEIVPFRRRIEPAIPPDLLEQIGNSQIAIVGCDSLGTEIATHLANLGVKALVLLDEGVVKSEQIGSLPVEESDIGKSLARVIANRLQPRFSNTMFHPICSNDMLRYSGFSSIASEFGKIDLWISACDTDFPRLAIAKHCSTYLLPHIDVESWVAADSIPYGEVRMSLPIQGCILCSGAIRDLDQANYELHAPTGALPRRPPLPWNSHGRIGALSYITGFVASFTVKVWLDLLSGKLGESKKFSLRWNEHQNVGFDATPIKPLKNCKYCKGEW